MRRLFLELYNKNIFPSTPITSFSPFLSYIVVTPLILGFEKDFSCHSHLGPIRIPSLFSFPPAPFPRNEKEDGTLELYYLSAYCLPKILLLQLVGHRVIQISCVLCGFPMLQLPYQFGRSGMDRLNILLGSLVFTLLCGIHSRLALGITSSSGWNSSKNPTTSPTSLPPTVSRTSIETEWFHVLSSIGYSSPFVSLFPIAVSMSLQDWMALRWAMPRVGELQLQKWNERPFKLRHCMHTSTMDIFINLLSKGAEMKCDQISGLTDQTNLAQLQSFKAWQNVLPICPTNRAICDPSLEFRQVR